MRKLIAIGVLVGGLLAGAGPAMAQVSRTQGGIGDPLTLAASGVLIPYVTAGGSVSLLEIASPVADNPNLHMQFFDANCSKVGPSVGMPLTTNDIAFQQVVAGGGILPLIPPGVPNGLVAISGVGTDGFSNKKLDSPIHSRMYVFNPADGTSRVLEPIILDTAEFPGDPHTWSPLRTAATFFSPLVDPLLPPKLGTVHTRLTLICPTSTIQGAVGGYFTDPLFPQILPPFPATLGPKSLGLEARIYDTNESFKRNVIPIDCSCFTEKDLSDPTFIDAIYSNAAEVPFGTYTELETILPGTGSFTGYKEIFTVGSPNNHFFSRLSNGNRLSIQGTVTNAR